MADPVTAAVLAEALREAVQAQHAIFGGTDDNGDRWQGILDRYDAQVRANAPFLLRCHIDSEDGRVTDDMEFARFTRSETAKTEYVRRARETNRNVVRLRRQLRALERNTDGTH